MKQETDGQFFHSVEDMRLHNKRDTLEACRQHGFDVFQEEDAGHTWAGKHSTAEVIDVFPDGSWSYRDSSPENPAAHTVAVGMSGVFLKYFFVNPKMYLESQRGD